MDNPETIKEMADRYFLDAPPYFIAVYHHTILPTEARNHTPPREGETRYTAETPFLDPIVLLTALAQETSECQLFTTVLIAPQMQTVNLAKQAADLANISKGRLNLGLGVGWSQAEMDSLGMNFNTRGKRLNAQIPLLELLWTGKKVTHQIDQENINGMALNPIPKHDIPIWVGGLSDAALERAAKYADGWMPLENAQTIIKNIPLLIQYLEIYERNLEEFKIMGRVPLGMQPLSKCVEDFLKLKEAGITHVALTTTGKQLDDWSDHRTLIIEFLKATEEFRRPPRLSFIPQNPSSLTD